MRGFSPVKLVAAAATLFSAVSFSAAQPLDENPSEFYRYISGRIVSGATAGNDRATASAARVEDICPIDRDPVAARVFAEYGAMFVAEKIVRTPETCMFATAEAVEQFQRAVSTGSADFGGTDIVLQTAALEALLKARTEAADMDLDITPLDGAIAGRRSFNETVVLWHSRYLPALSHWQRQGAISREEASYAGFETRKQIEKVIEWESRGYLFAPGRSRSIFSSVAPPGTSQHLAMLAFDVVEHSNPVVRDILNRNGWFQTIVNDPPHFTFLGVSAAELPKRGLRAVSRGGYTFWVPNMEKVRR